MKIDLKTSSPEQTEQFAASFAALLKAGDIITLDGDLGAGKTCFTRGLVKGIGSDAMVSSPTFTIVNEYEGGRLNVYHFDTYRLGDSEEFLMSGLDEYFYQGGVSVIEWSSIITDIIPAGSIGIDITGNGDERYFSVDMPDDRYDALKTIIEEMGS